MPMSRVWSASWRPTPRARADARSRRVSTTRRRRSSTTSADAASSSFGALLRAASTATICGAAAPSTSPTRALAHWQLGAAARRRARARPCAHADARADGWDAPHTVVDIVNDDMPFLVDSVTMALDRHDLGVHLVVHPILRVRRDADGTLRGLATPRSRRGDDVVARVVGARRGRPRDQRGTCSTTVRARHRARARRRARRDRRLAEDARRAAARRATSSTRNRRRVDADELAEGRALLRWMGDQHFTFLGVPRVRPRARRRRRRTAAGRRAAASASLRDAPERTVGELRAAARPRSAAKARDRTLLVLTKANRALDRAPADVSRLRRRASGSTTTATSSASTGSSACTRRRRTTRARLDVPVLRRKVAAGRSTGPGSCPRATTTRTCSRSSRRTRATTCSRSTSTSCYETAMGILRLQERRRVRLFVHREPYGRFVSCLVFLPRDRYTTPVRERIAEILTEAFGAREPRVEHAPVGVGARPVALRAARRPAAPDHGSTAMNSKRASPRRPGRGSTTCATRCRRARGEEARPRLAAHVGRRLPGRVPGRLRRARGARRLAHLARPRRATRRPRGSARTRDRPRCSTSSCTALGAQPSLSDVLPRLDEHGRRRRRRAPVHDHAAAARRRAGSSGSGCACPDTGMSTGSRASLFEEAFLAVARRRRRGRRLQPARARAPGSAWREVASAARVQPVPAPDRHAVQPGVHRGRARRAPRPRAPARRAVRRPARPVVATAQAATPTVLVDEIARRARRGHEPRRGPHPARAACTSCSRRCARTGSSRTPTTSRARAIVFKLDPTQIPDLPLPRPMFEIFVYSPRGRGRAPARRARSRVAASAGRTGARTSAPRSSG